MGGHVGQFQTEPAVTRGSTQAAFHRTVRIPEQHREFMPAGGHAELGFCVLPKRVGHDLAQGWVVTFDEFNLHARFCRVGGRWTSGAKPP